MRVFIIAAKESCSLLVISLAMGVAVNGFRPEGLPLFPAGSEAPPSPSSIQTVSPEEAERIARTGKVSVIDLRPPELFDKAHISGAVNMPFERVYSMTAVIQEKMPRGKGVLLYGKGVESLAVSDLASVLQMMGYVEIYTVSEEGDADDG